MKVKYKKRTKREKAFRLVKALLEYDKILDEEWKEFKEVHKKQLGDFNPEEVWQIMDMRRDIMDEWNNIVWDIRDEIERKFDAEINIEHEYGIRKVTDWIAGVRYTKTVGRGEFKILEELKEEDES